MPFGFGHRFSITRQSILWPPFGLSLDQNLSGFPVSASGLILDKKSGLPAQLVEQPCGVLNGTSAKVALGSAFTLSFSGSAISFKATIDDLVRDDCIIGTSTTQYAQKIQFVNSVNDRIIINDDNDNGMHSNNTVITDNEIHHFIINLDGANSKIWVDNVDVTLSNVLDTDVTLNLFGVRVSDRWHEGKLFDIAVYNKTLSEAEMTSLNNGNLITDGLTNYWPDLSTGYDIIGDNHGTVTDVTVGTQDESAVIQSIGFNKYLKNTVAGIVAIESSQAYGEWLIPLYKGADANYLIIHFMNTSFGIENSYLLAFSDTERIQLIRYDNGIYGATLLQSAVSYISNNTMYLTKIVRNKTTDQYVTGPIGTFAVYIIGGAFGWTSWTLVDVSGGSGTNPITDNTYTTSACHVNDINAGDMYGKNKQTDENGNVRWLSDDINDWHVVSGTFENHLVPADLSAPTKDVLGNHLHYLPKGILPLGAIDFKPTDGENFIQGDNYDFDTVGDWTGAGATITGGYDSGDDGHDKCLRIEADSASNDRAELAVTDFEFTPVLSNTYLVTFDYKFIDAPTSNSSVGLLGIIKTDLDKDSLTWTKYSAEFTATNIVTQLRIYVHGDVGTVDNELLIDNISIIDITETKLEVFNRNNTDGVSQLWKPEIQDIPFNPTYPWRHDLDKLTNGDYIRVLGTQLLIQRLFFKAFKTDDDWVAIINILNFGEVLDATKRQKVFNFLKDPSKSNQEAWELYQSGSVVVAYRLDQSLSLYNEDEGLCRLGWEAEDVARTWAIDLGDPVINGDEITFDNDASADSVREAGYWEAGKKYKINCTVTGYSGAGLGIQLPYDGAIEGLQVTANGTYEYTYKPANVSAYVYCYADTGGVVTVNFIIEVGNTVSKVLDVGNGGCTGENEVSNSFNWIDTNEDGVADDWILVSGAAASIVTGNGFSGKAQRTEPAASHGRIYQEDVFTSGKKYRVSMKYRASDMFSIYANGVIQKLQDITSNTGDAIGISFDIDLTESGNLFFYQSSGANKWIEIDEVKVIDLTLTYYNLTQSNLSLQPKRVAGGIDWIKDEVEYNIDASMNGKYCYVKSLEHGTFVGYFIITGGKIRGSDIYSQNSDSYKVKALSIYDSEQEGLIEMVILKQSDDEIRKTSDGMIIRLRKY